MPTSSYLNNKPAFIFRRWTSKQTSRFCVICPLSSWQPAQTRRNQLILPQYKGKILVICQSRELPLWSPATASAMLMAGQWCSNKWRSIDCYNVNMAVIVVMFSYNDRVLLQNSFWWEAWRLSAHKHGLQTFSKLPPYRLIASSETRAKFPSSVNTCQLIPMAKNNSDR